jgi:hypothetical protein
MWLAVMATIGSVTTAEAAVINLNLVLSNSGYESGLTNWTATFPGSTYQPLGANFGVNPTIQPLNPLFSNGTLLAALTAPVGSNFIGVLNPTDEGDLKGKLAHSVVSAMSVLGTPSFAVGDTFEVTVWANRGRLATNGNTTSIFPSTTGDPELNVQLRRWPTTQVATPVLTANPESWTGSDTVLNQFFDFSLLAPGQWGSQKFTFVLTAASSFITLSIAGQNNNHDQYVAWDLGTPIPEPAGVLLVGTGLVALLRRRSKKRASAA